MLTVDPAGSRQPRRSAPRRRCRRCSTATSHPYGRPAKGHDRDRRTTGPADLQAFTREFFSPESTSLVVVGDIDPDEAFERIDARLRRVGRRRRPQQANVPPVDVRASGRRRSIFRCRASRRAISRTASSRSTGSIPAYYSYWVMNNILGQFGLGGRLAENIRERQGMAYYAFSAFDPSLGPGSARDPRRCRSRTTSSARSPRSTPRSVTRR